MTTKFFQTILRGFFLSICLLFVFSSSAFAVSADIKLSPQTRDVSAGETFTLSLDINSDTRFNAAKAMVLISSILSVENLTLGDCNFAFVKTPTQSQPSFVGVILGGYTQQCRVYTLTLRAIRSGVASINFFDAEVIGYEKAPNIPVSVHNGAYTVLGTSEQATAQPTPIDPPLLDAQGNKLYTINYTVPLPANTPASSLSVVLQMTPSGNQTNTPVSNPTNPSTATVTFENVPEGVHKITTMKEEKPIDTQIVTVAGESRHLAFGNSEKKESPIFWYVAAAIGILALSIIAGVIYWRYNRTRFTPEI